MARPLTRILQEAVHLNIGLFLNLVWGWFVSVVVMHTDVQTASGMGDVLFVAKIRRMWYVGEIQMQNTVGNVFFSF